MSEREEPAATGTVEELSVRMERLREELRSGTVNWRNSGQLPQEHQRALEKETD